MEVHESIVFSPLQIGLLDSCDFSLSIDAFIFTNNHYINNLFPFSA